MADDKNGRDKQAQDAERRQRVRAVAAELERANEPEPAFAKDSLADVERELASVPFPATGADVVRAAGDHEIESTIGSYQLAELVPEAAVETFDSPAAVRDRIKRPAVAAAMKRFVEAAAPLQNAELRASQRDAYERTLQELEDIDTVDDDAAIPVIRDWILGHIDEKGTLPGSRAVRREAATVCRSEGYEVRNDEWLGV